jgi:hypothetical protein
MISRPTTRIELKLEDDFMEYQEMDDLRRKNIEKASLILSPDIKEPFKLGPDDYNGYFNQPYSPFKDYYSRKSMNANIFPSDDNSNSKSITSDIAMD